MKVVLVIDKPSDCSECPCCDARRDENGDFYIAECQADCDYDRDSWIDETTFAIPSWCPLRQLPQKKHDGLVFTKDGRAFTPEMEIGWNACIDAIMGEA